MFLKLLIAITALSLNPTEGKTCGSTTGASSVWTRELFPELAKSADMWFSIPVTSQITGGWTVEMEFSDPVQNIQIWSAKLDSHSSDLMTHRLTNEHWNGDQSAGSVLGMNFLVEFVGPITPTFIVRLSGQLDCSASTTEPIEDQTTTSGGSGTLAPEVTLPDSASFDYYDALDKSILFYEAQRSGKLPANNRIPYRGDSALNDKGDGGEDLTGGWYDAGDFVKFGHPMAGTATILAWGLIEYRSGYANAGQLDIMLDSIKWATDYFLKCHTGTSEFYGQVGNGGIDHSKWGRPEEMDESNRPAYVLTPSKPGSDLLGETAAALAAASIAFTPTDTEYATTLLDNARDLYIFAKTYKGKYSESIPDAAGFYSSSGYYDELGWAAAWLYRATSEEQYLNDAVGYYDSKSLGDEPWAFDWDDKKAGLQVLMYQLTQETKYKDAVTAFLDGWLPGGDDVTYTPLGLAWRIQWGPNRYAANVAFLALVAADLGMNPTSYRDFARNQINYILGSSGRSYVVGFGVNPPDRPHHRSSSCPDQPATCSWTDYHADAPNPQILNGAVVGGPDQNDFFENDRTDFVKNEVACDYNAGFQSSVAGIITLMTTNK